VLLKNLSEIVLTSHGITIGIGSEDGNNFVQFSSCPIGQETGNLHSDFYVYEWFIQETGEVFYIGKGRKNRFKERHLNADIAEKIREQYNTGVKFASENLTEEQAIELESSEMIRILNETTDRLTNRFIPFFTKRGNGYDRSPNTPPLAPETAPCLYANENEEHYFNVQYRPFDRVEIDNLKSVCFVDMYIAQDISNIVYRSEFDRYYEETKSMLENNGHTILKSKYAKSVTAWIYCDDGTVANYNIRQEQATIKLRRNIPAYHLIDVWKFLTSIYGNEKLPVRNKSNICPKHNRVPLSKIKNANDWDRG